MIREVCVLFVPLCMRMAILSHAGLYHSDGFDVYLAALPTGWCHRLLAGCNCKVRDIRNRQQCSVTKAQNHDKGSGGETVTGVHMSVKGIENKRVTGSVEKTVGTEVYRGQGFMVH